MYRTGKKGRGPPSEVPGSASASGVVTLQSVQHSPIYPYPVVHITEKEPNFQKKQCEMASMKLSSGVRIK